MVVKNVYCAPNSQRISSSFLSIHCWGIHTAAAVIHHNYHTFRFTLSAVVLHEKTAGDPVEVYNKKRPLIGVLPCAVWWCVRLLCTLRKYILYVFQVMLSLPLQIGH